MRAIWGGNAHQLQNYDFFVIKVQGCCMGCLTQSSWQDHAVLQFNSAFRQCTPARPPEPVNVCSGYFILLPRERGRLENQEPTIFGKKKSFPPPFLFCVSYSLRPVHAIVLSLLFEGVAEKSRPSLGASGKNVSKTDLKSKIRLSPFCFSLRREKRVLHVFNHSSGMYLDTVWVSPSIALQILTVSSFKQELSESNFKCSFCVFLNKSHAIRGSTSPRVFGVSSRHFHPTPRRTYPCHGSTVAVVSVEPLPPRVLVLHTNPMI